MKNLNTFKKYFTLAIFSIVILLCIVRCRKDPFDLIVCDSCSPSKPWSVWSIDLSNPCFETKADCEAWAEGHLGPDTKCMKCDH